MLFIVLVIKRIRLTSCKNWAAEYNSVWSISTIMNKLMVADVIAVLSKFDYQLKWLISGKLNTQGVNGTTAILARTDDADKGQK